MTELQSGNLSVEKVFAALDSVGLHHNGIHYGGVIDIRGGVDISKARCIQCFAEKITDHNAEINSKIFQAEILAGRRALLAHVVGTLIKAHGAEVIHHTLTRDFALDEAYKVRIDDLNMSLWLSPK